MIGNYVNIGKDNVYIDETATIDDFVSIGNNVRIGREVKICRNTIIKDNVEIGDYAIIEENCIIGYNNLTRVWDENFDKKVVIGKRTIIRPACVIYMGCKIGDNSRINHNVIIRENTKIGNNTSLGCLIKCEGYTEIGDNCSIHSHTALTSFMKIEDYVFMGPHCITINDPKIDYKRKLRVTVKGPTIKFGARIGSGVMICPGITVGREAFIGAHSIIIKDIPDFKRVFSIPAQEIITEVSEEERLKI